jgi:thymidylate synthase
VDGYYHEEVFMRNRAKCKLCQDIIESFHSTDLVICKCGEIYVDAGESMKCGAGNWDNFLRVDDEGNEIVPIIKEKGDVKPLYTYEEYNEKLTKKELIDMLDNMIKKIEEMPYQSMTSPITQYDYYAGLLLLSALFKSL